VESDIEYKLGEEERKEREVKDELQSDQELTNNRQGVKHTTPTADEIIAECEGLGNYYMLLCRQFIVIKNVLFAVYL